MTAEQVPGRTPNGSGTEDPVAAALADSEGRSYDGQAVWYDRLIVDPAAVVAFYTGLIGAPQRSLLELGCGTGIVTAAMATRLREIAGGEQLRVVGLDASADMLAIARRRDPSVDWIHGDMRAIPPCGPFDLVACCYNTLQHLDAAGLGTCFRGVRAVVAPGGRFAFDIYRPNLPYLRIERRDDPVRRVAGPDGAMFELREDSVFDEPNDLLHLTWTLVDPMRPPAPPVARLAFRIWQHHPSTVEAALAAAGLRVIERFGDLALAPWGPEAKKQVVVCAPA
jgi:SAM-dependent methyltransferase